MPPGGVRELDAWCDTCKAQKDARDEALRAPRATANTAALLEAIPPAYRKTERSKLPHPEKLDAALEWKYGRMGLVLFGLTGCGKSRIAWEVCKREILAGKSFRAVNAFDLTRYPSLFMAGGNEAQAFAERLVKADLVLFDDVFKAKATERVEELLFSVIDERGAWERPCIVTLNDTGETLTNRLSPDRGPALIRRLRDYCSTLKF